MTISIQKKSKNKKELIEVVSAKVKKNNIRYPKWELTSIIDPVLKTIIETLSHEEEVHLNKFGRFTIKYKKALPITTSTPDKRRLHSIRKSFSSSLPEAYVSLIRPMYPIPTPMMKNKEE